MNTPSQEHQWSETDPKKCARCGAERYKTGTYCPGPARARAKMDPRTAAIVAAILGMGAR